MKRKLLMMVMFLLSIGVVLAQRTVSGKVTSADDGSGIPGVNVVLKGTTTGTTTDIDGNYRVSVPEEGGTLSFSFIGMIAQEQVIGARSVIDVSMQSDVKQLAEVIVTGYGSEAKRDITGAIANVGAAELANIPAQSFDRALQGRASGVLVQAVSGAPGAGININIRGQGSLRNNTPLYIIDGVQVSTTGISTQGSSNPLAGINPQDIESIEILKDAASAAIYGAQSANGVVIVTTKKGLKNTTDVEINYQTGFTSPLNLYDVMNAQEFAEIKREAYVNAGLNTATSNAIYGNPEDPSSLTPMDWVDAAFKDKASMSAFQARVSGGSDKTRFVISVGSEKQDGQIIKSDWSRSSFRLNLDHQASDKLSFGAYTNLASQNLFGSITNGNFVNGPFQSAFVSQPNSPARDSLGNFNPYPAHLPITGAGHNFNYNIIQGVEEERRETFARQALASANARYEIFDFLSVNLLGGIDVSNSYSVNERPPSIPAFAALRGQVAVTEQTVIDWNTSATVNFNKTFADDHTVSAIIGGELKESTFRTTAATGRNFANPALRLLGDAATPFAVGGTYNEWQRAGAFIKGSYNYKSKYYVNGTFRRDGHSRFGAQNRVGDFWSVGASYRIIEEDFMSGLSFIDDLKIRFSSGKLGNANGIGNYEAISAFRGARQYAGAAGSELILANDQLTWEESFQNNIGLDFGILGNKLTGSVDVFRNDTESQLFPVPISDDSGFGNVTSNVGTVRNEGIEIELSSVNLDVAGFTWTTTFNVTFQKNQMLELPGGIDTLGTQLIVGQPIQFIWGVDYAGVNPANGRPMWYNRAGEARYGGFGVNDAEIIGSPIPGSFGGLSNTFSYKGITLDVFFQYQLDAEAFLSDMYNLAYSGSTGDNQLRSQLDRWQQPGDVTNVPRAIEGGSISGYDTRFPGQNPGRYVSDASYVRLKTLSLSYDLPKSVLDIIKMKSVRLFFVGTNLVTWTKFDGIDPEVVLNNTSQGLSTYGVFPVGRQITGGVNIKF